jgi:transposase
MGHRKGESRGQASLFPIMLEELVEAGSVVRVVDAWVGTLDVKQLGFGRAQARAMGRPPYDPGDLLRLYIWGYLNGVRSSRALERECRRNVECMWLLGRLAPDHKTIAEFRRCNSEAMVKVCAAFVQFGRAQHLIAGTTVAIDGSKVGAVASRKAVIKREDLQEQARRNAEEIRKYLEGLDQADDQAGPSPAQGPQVQVALEQLRKEGARIARGVEQLASSGSSALVSTEPEARIMKSLHGKPGCKRPSIPRAT